MTHRRWARGHEDPGQGPLEIAARAELEALGWNPLTPPGPLRTAAERVCALAETIDWSQNAQALPALDRQVGAAMDEARRAAKGGGLTQEEEDAATDEVSDFERRRRNRGAG